MSGTALAGSDIIAPSGFTAPQLYDAFVHAYDSIRDPILKIACAFLTMNLAMSGTIQLKADDVQNIAKRMAGAHDMMAMLNTQLQALATSKGATAADTERWPVFVSPDYATVKALFDKFVAAGVPVDNLEFTGNRRSSDGQYEIVMTKGQMTTNTQNIQAQVDDFSSASQQGQLDLQTLMNRYNSLVEAVTAAIKKYEGEAVGAANGIRGT